MTTPTAMRITRIFRDGGGEQREMTQIYDATGTQIFEENGTGVVCALLEYDSLDESAIWSDDLARLASDYPTLSDIVRELDQR